MQPAGPPGIKEERVTRCVRARTQLTFVPFLSAASSSSGEHRAPATLLLAAQLWLWLRTAPQEPTS